MPVTTAITVTEVTKNLSAEARLVRNALIERGLDGGMAMTERRGRDASHQVEVGVPVRVPERAAFSFDERDRLWAVVRHQHSPAPLVARRVAPGFAGFHVDSP